MEFVILPDCPQGTSVAESIGGAGTTVVEHPSGRPWIVGRWSPGEIVAASAGRHRIVALGIAATTAEDLAARLGRIRDLGELDRIRSALPGSYHLVASMNGRVGALGTLSTARQIFHTRIAGVVVAADRPQSLAALSGACLNEEFLALQLISPYAPWPLSDYNPWRRVEALSAGHRLELDRDGSGREVRWWRPPAPEVPLTEGAERVRAALHDAVAARVATERPLSTDLSGGMDSTSLAFLAAGQVDRFVTTRWQATNVDDEDQNWAQRAAASIPNAAHIVLERQGIPMNFAGLLAGDPDIEAPFAWIRTRERLAFQAGRLAELGSTMHLTGHGGDELFFPTPLQLHALLRSQPWTAIKYLRGFRSIYRWALPDTLRGIAADQSFPGWLAGSAATLTDSVRGVNRTPNFGWWGQFRTPPWVTRTGVDSVRELLADAAAKTPEPLSPIRAQHATIQDIRKCGESIRRVGRLTARHGVDWQAPFVDDQVVEAALSIRFADSASPHRYKPVLVESMRGTVPTEVLGRGTKSEYSADVYAGLRSCRGELAELCDDMLLAQRGLVDADRFRTTLLGQHTSSAGLSLVVATLACEVWLRSVAAFAPTAVLTGGAR
ncbi:asparagine synthase-related protein [Actinoalloteichus hymeniacidonis]|uniref:asparagine synthase (glutamine-hydrolyzing) n=1 Tax=Actinoalloteichus hymeniacidonis TaxID=340345 RepID=A0AAC9MXZ7_9PSEU|nr:asparagine synthase-related protein [Actinoalloteichus hymeniacidonis]AOS62356.1 Asparagine synthase [Actinoalloteichus hymeniacidonis]MBB5909616.1 asparagine synthase (glutamine-hydrolyzing) [Actinoalloteichus hymeniacidonis]